MSAAECIKRIFKIGTRASPLAIKQVEEVVGYLKEFYPEMKYEICRIDTCGDKDKITPISDIEGTDFFTKEIDTALLEKKIDFAVHSAKDIPDKIADGLYLAAITKPLDNSDALVSKNNLKLSQLPHGAKIGASSQRRKTQLKAYRSDLQIVDIRGTISERLKKLQNSDLDGIIVASCALIRLGLENNITEKIAFDILKPHPWQGALAVVARKEDEEMIEVVRKIDMRNVTTSNLGGFKVQATSNLRGFNAGKVYLVGAGPGDPGLITVKGLEVLRLAEVVIYDYLVDKRLLDEVSPDAELICTDTLGKKKHLDGFLKAQENINAVMVKKAKEGKKVIRLKNGDPAIFSRISQELDALTKEKIEFQIIPGVTAASAAGALNGISLTDRRFASNCVFVTGHEDQTKSKSSIDWDTIAKNDTIVLYMAVESLANIVKRLVQAGKDKNTPIAIIHDVSLITQKVLTGTLKDILAKARKATVKPPAIIIIGEVVKLEAEFNWLKKNKRVLFTGLSKERFFIKGNYFHLPLIKIVPMQDYKEFDNYLRNIQAFDWIVFGSRYGVEYFFPRLKSVGYDSRILSGIKIAAVGNSTKEKLLEFSILADLTPKKESSEGLIEEFKKIDIAGKKFFLPRSDISDKGLSDALRGLGADITTSFAYRNIMPKELPDLDLKAFDEIMFTSPSTVRNFLKRYGKPSKKNKIKCIGDVTLREAKRCHLLP